MKRASFTNPKEHENNSMRVPSLSGRQASGRFNKNYLRMKTVLIIIFFVAGAFVNPAKAQYPIPSYNVSVSEKASFEENDQSGLSTANPCRIRNLIVHATCVHSASSEPTVLVWIYSLDGENTYGPYSIGTIQTTFAIDNRQWGLLLMTDTEILVNVWIE